MVKKILLIQIIFLFFQAQAQNSFNSGGGDAANSKANVSYSLGQLFYEPYASYGGTLKLTPGVQQSYLISVVTSDETMSANVAGINLYPNPVTDFLELSFGDYTPSGDLQAAIYDLTGKLTGIYHIDIPVTRIQAAALEPGVYLLKVTSGNVEVKTFKVIKK
jgi:hypothetical protein